MSRLFASNYTKAKIKKGLEQLDANEREIFLTHVNKTLSSQEYRYDQLKSDLFTIAELESWKKESPSRREPKLCDTFRNASTATLTIDDVDDSTSKSKEEGASKVVGSHRVLKTLGEGTFGKVRLCEHVLSDEKVAIKTIQKADVKTSKQRNSVQREVRLMKLLKHPHIIDVRDVNENKDEISIIMEFASGGELFDYIVSKGMLKERESRIFFRQIISAVSYCHQNSVIHRDLKPENMLLDSNKNIKLIDFGFGNTYHSERLLETYCGSPFYAAPEMIRGQPYCGPEVDIWSMGVILYALLAGRLPFESPAISDLYKEIGKGEYAVPAHFSQGAVQLIGRMLTVDPSKRATMDEIISHPWVNDGYLELPCAHVPPRPKVVLYPNPESIAELVDFGIAENEIRRVLGNNSGLHPISSLYHLVDEARIRRASRQEIPTLTTEKQWGPGADVPRFDSRNTVFSQTPKQAFLQSSEDEVFTHSADGDSSSSQDEDSSPPRRAGVWSPGPRNSESLHRKSNADHVALSISTSSGDAADDSNVSKRQKSIQNSWVNPIQEFFYGKSSASSHVAASPPAPAAKTKTKLSEFFVDHLFNLKAEFHETDIDKLKREVERVLVLFGIGIYVSAARSQLDFYFSPELNAFMCKERNGSQSFTIDIQVGKHSPQRLNLFFKCGPGYGNVFLLRKLYSKMLEELKI